MKILRFSLAALFLATLVFTGCSPEDALAPNEQELPTSILNKISKLGFSTDGAFPTEDGTGYIVENDIFLTDADLDRFADAKEVPGLEQYSTNNLVNAGGGRVITMYANEGGRNGYSAGMIAGLDMAIARYNALNLSISFERINTDNADITMTRLKKGDERRGILGSAGFPTASGDPYGEIKMSGILESSYGLSTEGIATIIAHEIGHCIGFRHTDFFDRSISCNSGGNEGASTVGANHIPGTPTGATLAAKSFMLACTDGGDRPFNNDDRTALNYLY